MARRCLGDVGQTKRPIVLLSMMNKKKVIRILTGLDLMSIFFKSVFFNSS